MSTFSQEDKPDISESAPNPLIPLLGDNDLSGLIQFGLTEAASDQFTDIIAQDSELVPGRVTRVDGISTFVQTSTIDYRAVSKFARIAHKNGGVRKVRHLPSGPGRYKGFKGVLS